jgi:restriction endonuclease Mrr
MFEITENYRTYLLEKIEKLSDEKLSHIIELEKKTKNPHFEPALSFFKGWLAGQSKHLATHTEDSGDNGGYCYTRPNGYDYSGKQAYPVTVEKAFEKNWIKYDAKNKTITGHTDWAGLRLE